MGIFNKKEKRSAVAVTNASGFEGISAGYTTMSRCPEVVTAVDRIAELVASMTIHLMSNTANGDVRINNELSRKVDINPWSMSTRQTFIKWIIRTMYLEGDGNAIVLPITSKGLLEDLLPVPSSKVRIYSEGPWKYTVGINGEMHEPNDVLHFVLNPDSEKPYLGTGHRMTLSTVVQALGMASGTELSFFKSNWKPSLIVKVDGLTDEYSSKKGRKKLLETYLETSAVGEPWLIPADQFDVTQVKPLTLNDLAMSEHIQLDKRTVASILGVPPYLLGVGEFNREAWNNFINSKIMPLVRGIEQELTRKLLMSPKWYFRFNSRSLYSYDLKDLSAVADDQFVRGIMSGNEVRDWIGLSPREGLDELVILENYIPRGMIGDQKKLQGGEAE